jgi:hypothetical protein
MGVFDRKNQSFGRESMNPKEIILSTMSPIQRLEESLAREDRRSLDQRIIDALKEGQRHLYNSSLSSIDTALRDRAREEIELARRDFSSISPGETFMEGVNRVLQKFAEDLERVQLVPDETTAHHESGHLVVGYANGSKVGKMITCCQHNMPVVGWVWGFAEFETHPTISAQVMTVLAGPLAELRYTASRTAPKDFRFDTSYAPVWGDRLDYGRLLAPWNVQTEVEYHQAMQILRSVGFASSFAKLMCMTQATLNCPNVWEAIERLATELYRHKMLSGENAVGIISSLVQPPPAR